MGVIYKILLRIADQMSTKKLIVLTYHRIFLKSDEMHPNEVHVAKFTWQMELLHRYFNVLSLSDALAHIEVGSLPPRSVCLTFDDGYASCYSEVLPILQRFGFSAGFFVVSSALNKRGMWNDWVVETVRSISADYLDLSHLGLEHYRLDDKASVANKIVEAIKYLPLQQRTEICKNIGLLCETPFEALMLTTEQIQEMQKLGMEIGGHTQNHPILKNLTLSEAEQEIRLDKQELEQIINAPIRYFAYPNGKLDYDYISDHVRLVKQCGYEAALTTEKGHVDRNSDLWQLPRLSPWDNTPFRFMLSMLSTYFT